MNAWKKLFLLIVTILATFLLLQPRTPVSTAETRTAAIGPLEGLPESERRLYDSDADFHPLGKPKPGDWLAMFPEPGQGWATFAKGDVPRPTAERKTLYLVPFGDFPVGASPSVDALRSWLSAWYCLPAKVLPMLATAGAQLTIREKDGVTQYLTRDLITLAVPHLPADGYMLLVVTMADLYPGPNWNFVFGEADPVRHTGVFSFARYRVGFPAPIGIDETWGTDATDLKILRRSCKVLAHEAGHLFGLAHCVFYECLMNGSNSLPESDSRPQHECPVCLRKLQTAIGFDARVRYRALRDLSRTLGFADEADWYAQRLAHIGG